jgi:undecaprenyl-diphosphatase
MDQVIISGASYLYLVILVISLVSFLYLNKPKKISFLKLLIPTSVTAYLLAKLAGLLIHSPRPFVVENIKPLIHAATDNGFPSDHTLLSMVLALVVVIFNRKIGIVLIVLAVIVGITRVLAHAHHWVDIVGSISIAILATYTSYKLLKRM